MPKYDYEHCGYIWSEISSTPGTSCMHCDKNIKPRNTMPHSKNGLNYDELATSWVDGNINHVIRETIGNGRHVAGVARALLVNHTKHEAERYLKGVLVFER